ncbi:MAG: alpha/beta fold hydrolase, partial [Bacteroidota bacterium]
MKYLLTIALACFFCGILFAQSENQPTMETWNYPYEVHTLALDDTTTIAYVDEGEGSKTLLFVHGLGSYLRAWDKNISVLSKDYRCIAVDLPGYGKSSKGNYAFDMQFFAQALQQFIQQLDLKEITLVGHSMGGQIAMHVVLDEVAAVEKLVLLAPAGFEVFTDQEKAWF